MALTLLYSHSLSFANDAAFRAEYPYDPPTDMSTSASTDCAWGATNGPDGQPGVKKTGGFGTFGFDVSNLVPQGHLFRVKGRWKFDGTAGSNGSVSSMWWAEPGNHVGTFEGNLFQVNYNTLGDLLIVAQTTAPYANGAGDTYSETVSGAVTPGVAFTLRIDGRRSTMTETSPGVFAPEPDGWLKVYVDDVLIADFGPMPLWLNAAGLGVNAAGYYWNSVTFETGYLSDIEIWHELDTALPPIDPSETQPCCNSAVDPKAGETTTGAAEPENPFESYQPWTPNCEGGGMVELVASPSDSESWAA